MIISISTFAKICRIVGDAAMNPHVTVEVIDCICRLDLIFFWHLLFPDTDLLDASLT